MFAGSYALTIDDKGRMAIPARFRAQIADEFSSQLFITRSHHPCLEIYPAPAFHAVAAQIKTMDDRPKADLLNRIFIGSAVETEMDKQGRVLLPQLLRKLARLDSDAMLVGQIDRFDIWAEDLWNQKFGEGSDVSDLAAAFAVLKR